MTGLESSGVSSWKLHNKNAHQHSPRELLKWVEKEERAYDYRSKIKYIMIYSNYEK